MLKADTFARDNLPPRELWPDLINLDKLGYRERLRGRQGRVVGDTPK